MSCGPWSLRVAGPAGTSTRCSRSRTACAATIPSLRITCLGTPRGLENEIIPPRGYDLRHIPAYQLPRAVNMHLVRTPDRMWKAARATRHVLDDVHADVVVGFGGYVSVPAYLAAWRRKTPTVIHEVNVPPGVANKMGMRFTKNVAVGFPYQTEQVESLKFARVTGVPLRSSIARLDRAATARRARAYFGLDPDRPTLFVFGASQGARSINLAMAGAAKALTSAGVQVLHIIGARNEPVDIPYDLPVPYVTTKFLSEMELGYAAADLILCRGGAMTCAEVAAVGAPAIYVPLPVRQRRAAAQRAAGGRGGRRHDPGGRRPEPGLDRGEHHPADPRPAADRGDGCGRGGLRAARRRRGAAYVRLRSIRCHAACWRQSSEGEHA